MKLRSFVKSRWGLLLIAAVLVRILLASLLYHPDIKTIYQESRYLDLGIVDAYVAGAAANTPLHYPPPIYLIYYYHQQINGWMFSNYFETWMADGGVLQTVNHPKIFNDLLVMKLPQIVADLAIAWFLVKMVDPRKKFMMAGVWLLNPISLYAIYGIGNFDVLPTLLVVVGLWAFATKRISWSYAALGLAAGFKVWPLLLLPFWLIADDRNWWKRGLGLLSCGAAFGLALLPILKSSVALKSVFLSNLTSGIFQAALPLGGGQELPLFMIFYGGLLVWLSVREKPWEPEKTHVVLLGILFGLSHFHPQWIVWMLPSLLLLYVREELSLKLLIWLCVSYLGVVMLFNDKFVSLGMMKAVNNSFDSVEALRWWLDKVDMGVKAQSAFHGLFLGVVIVIFASLVRLIKVNDFRTPLWQLRTWLHIWVAGLAGLFLIVHVPLVLVGKYVDSMHGNEQASQRLTAGMEISQEIMIENDGWSDIEIRLKNVGFQFQDRLLVRIREEGRELRRVEIPGQVIGDDYNQMVSFEPIADSGGKRFELVLSAPNVTTGTELLVPFDAEASDVINFGEQQTTGSLAYIAYFNPGGYLSHVGYSLGTIWEKQF